MLCIYMSCLHALPSLLVYWCALFCIFMVSIKNLDLDRPLSGWGYGECRAHFLRIRMGYVAIPPTFGLRAFGKVRG